MKTKFIIAAIALVVAFAFGRYTTPTKTITEIKTVEVEKKSTENDLDKSRHKETKTTETVKPDGTKTTTTDIIDDINVSKRTTTEEDKFKSVDDKKTVVKGGSVVSLSMLGGFSVNEKKEVLGAAVSKEVLGPISVGGFYLNNNVFGGSVGINF